jgi:serine/threonine protein kinase
MAQLTFGCLADPALQAPEQFRGAASPSSDLYSLGGTLLYLVSGQPPFAFPQERMRISYQDKWVTRLCMGACPPGTHHPTNSASTAAP